MPKPDLDRLASDVADAVIHHECECASRVALADSMFEALGFKRVRRPRRPNWRARDRFLTPYDRKMRAMMRGVWDKERRLILANMKRNPMPKGYAGRHTKGGDNIFIDSWLFPKTTIEKEINAKSTRLLLQLMQAGMERTIAEYALDVVFDVVNARAVSWLGEYTPKLSEKLATLDYDAIRGQLLEGFEAGESMRDLAARVNSTFDTFDQARAEKIAKTEVNRAANEGNLRVYKEAGFERKVWFANPGACEECELLDNEDRPLEERYFPPDAWSDGQGPPLHVNCRCAVAPFDSSWAD